jgi:hypothetical protein
MGRISRSAQPKVTNDDVVVDIVYEARRLAPLAHKATWYGFGSYFQGKSFSDIDVLIVCLTTEDAIVMRAATVELCMRWPIHLMIMTEDEQSETDFVGSERCVELYMQP